MKLKLRGDVKYYFADFSEPIKPYESISFFAPEAPTQILQKYSDKKKKTFGPSDSGNSAWIFVAVTLPHDARDINMAHGNFKSSCLS